MHTVRFSAPEEFVRELTRDQAQVARHLVRVTYLTTPSKTLPIVYVSLVATAVVAGDLYRLDYYCGELWNLPEPDAPTRAKAGRIKDQLELDLTAAGFEVRSGELLTDIGGDAP